MINLSILQIIDQILFPGLTGRLDVLNLRDRRYEIRDGMSVGVEAPRYGLARTILGSFTQHF